MIKNIRKNGVVKFFWSLATEPVPVRPDDYPINSLWYRGLEKKVSALIPGFILPNYLTLFRLIASIFLLWELTSLSNTLFLIIAAAAGLSDFLDGIVARARNQITKLGVLFDPLADKFLMATVLLLFLKRGAVDLSLVVFILCGESHLILIPLASFVFKILRRGRPTFPIKSDEKIKPVLFGKIKMYFYVFGFLFILIGICTSYPLWFDLGRKMVMIGVGFSWIAVIHYVWRWGKNPY